MSGESFNRKNFYRNSVYPQLSGSDEFISPGTFPVTPNRSLFPVGVNTLNSGLDSEFSNVGSNESIATIGLDSAMKNLLLKQDKLRQERQLILVEKERRQQALLHSQQAQQQVQQHRNALFQQQQQMQQNLEIQRYQLLQQAIMKYEMENQQLAAELNVPIEKVSISNNHAVENNWNQLPILPVNNNAYGGIDNSLMGRNIHMNKPASMLQIQHWENGSMMAHDEHGRLSDVSSSISSPRNEHDRMVGAVAAAAATTTPLYSSSIRHKANKPETSRGTLQSLRNLSSHPSQNYHHNSRYGENDDDNSDYINNNSTSTISSSAIDQFNIQPPKLTRKERLHLEHMRSIQQEIERLKLEKELEDYKEAIANERQAKKEEEEHARWLAEQAKHLQAVKMKLALVKEQEMLNLLNGGNVSSTEGPEPNSNNSGVKELYSTDDNNNIFSIDNSNSNSNGSSLHDANSVNRYRNLVFTEAGVQSILMPISSISGVVVLIDGLMIARGNVQGREYRIAVGVYTSIGQVISRVVSTPWISWSSSNSNLAMNDIYFVHPSAPSLRKELYKTDLLSETSSAPRILIELQVRDQEYAQRTLGWGAMALTKGINASIDRNRTYLTNGMWQVRLQTGISDPCCDLTQSLVSSRTDSIGGSSVDGWGKLEKNMEIGSVLLRIVESNKKMTAIGWTPHSQVLATKTTAQFTTPAAVLAVYADPQQQRQELQSEPALAFDYARKQIVSPRNPLSNFLSMKSKQPTSSPDGNSPLISNSPTGFIREPTPAPVTADDTFTSSILSADVGVRAAVPPASAMNSSRMSSRSNRPGRSTSKQLQVPGSATNVVNTDTSNTVSSFIDKETTPFFVSTSKDDSVPIPSRTSDTIAGDAVAPQDNEMAQYWVPGVALGSATCRYQRGDGVDLYIDGARFLPDNVTISRVTLKLFTSDKELIGSPYDTGSTSLSESAQFPSYNYKAECRSKAFPTSLIGLFRVDTIDCSTLESVIVGYSVIKLFCTRDRRAVSAASNDGNIYLNSGAFQLPIYAGKTSASLSEFSEDMLASQGRIPCSSLLVRIHSAPKSEDGLFVLSKEQTPPQDWSRLQLDLPPLEYSRGEYCGVLCEPSEELCETVAYAVKAKALKRYPRNTVPQSRQISRAGRMIATVNDAGYDRETTVEMTLMKAFSAQPMKQGKYPPRPKPTASDSEATVANDVKWSRSLLTANNKITQYLNYQYSVKYSAQSGISVMIQSLHNLMESKSLFSAVPCIVYNVISSVSPPGWYYSDPPFVEGVKFSTKRDWESPSRAQRFLDDPQIFRPPVLSESTCLILHVVGMKVERASGIPGTLPDDPVASLLPNSANKHSSSKADSSSGNSASTLKNCASLWTVFPLSSELFPGDGFHYVNTGYYQVPLFQGNPNDYKDIVNSDNPYKQLCQRLLLGSSNTSRSGKNAGQQQPLAPTLSPDGTSVLLRITNPLLSAISNTAVAELQSVYVDEMLSAAAGINYTAKNKTNSANAVGSIRNKEKFVVNPTTSTSSSKSLKQLLPNGITMDVKRLDKRISMQFSALSNLAVDN